MNLEERINEKPSFKEIGKELSNSCVVPGYNFYLLNRNPYFNRTSKNLKNITNSMLVTTEILFYAGFYELTQGNVDINSLLPMAVGFLGKVNGVQVGLTDDYKRDNNYD